MKTFTITRNYRFVSLLALSGLLSFAACTQDGGQVPAPSEKAASSAAPSAADPAASGSGAAMIAFELQDAVTVGALQIDVEYDGSGRFAGDGDQVECLTTVDGALSSFNHIADSRELKAAFVIVSGFTGPGRFAECRFEGSIKPGEFRIGIRDASTPDLEELTPPVVTAIVTAE